MAQEYTRRWACQRAVAVTDLSAECQCNIEALNLTADQILDLLDAASDALAKITHLPVGRCTKPYRPCRDACRYFDCHCACGANGIPLPGIMPTVTQVKVGGVVVDPATYATVKSPSGEYTLERFTADGTVDIWPHWQRVYLPSTAADTFEITIESGLPIDPIMKGAAAELACDFVSRLVEKHRTEDGVIAAFSYGVNVDLRRFGDPTDQETQNLAGLVWLRRFVSSNGGARAAAIYSPDMDRGWSLYERV